jgi:CRISPR type III-B/RAMP module RAMP protein Cmr1
MKQASITFKFVTPCIISGADQQKAELRAPSLRGQLRHWHRLLGEGTEAEKHIFGGIGKNDDVRASALVVRIATPASELKTFTGNAETIGTSKFDYFLWPLAKNERGVISPNQEATITIQHRRVQGGRELGLRTLQAFLLLGSLGTRSRRAYGGIYPTKVVVDGQLWNHPSDLPTLTQTLQSVLDGVSCRVLALDNPCPTASNAVAVCANYLKTFRCGKEFNGSSPSEWGEHDHDIPFRGHRKIHRPALGLPAAQNYRQARQENFRAKYQGSDRWASPVTFKVVPLDKGFLPLCLLWKDFLIPEGERIDIGRGKQLALSHDMLNAMMRPDPTYWSTGSMLLDNA